MKRPRIQDLRLLRNEMSTIARGERRAPSDAAEPSFNSSEAAAFAAARRRKARLEPHGSKEAPAVTPRPVGDPQHRSRDTRQVASLRNRPRHSEHAEQGVEVDP